MIIQKQNNGNNSLNMQAGRDIVINVLPDENKDLLNALRDELFSIKCKNSLLGKNVAHLIDEGNFNEAENELDNILNNVNGNYSSNLITIAILYTPLNQEKAQRCFEQAILTSPNNPRLLNSFGLLLLNRGEIAHAEQCFLNIIRNTSIENEYFLKAQGNLGVLYKNTCQFDKAITHLERSSASAFESIGSIVELNSLNNLGACYHNCNRLDDAVCILKRALNHSASFLESATNKNEKQDIKSLQANIYTNMAISLKNMYLKDKNSQHLEDAKEYLYKAISIEDILGNDNLLGRHFGNLSQVYLLLNDNINYEKYALLSFDIFRHHGSEKEKLVSEVNEGLFFNFKKDYSKSLIIFENLLTSPKIDNYPKIKALALINAANTYDSLGDIEKSRFYVNKAYDTSIKFDLQREKEHIEREFEEYLDDIPNIHGY